MTSLDDYYNCKNNNNKITCSEIINYFCILTCIFTILIFILILPIIEIYYGAYYYDNIDCVSIINIPLSLWLIVKGLYTIFNICIYVAFFNNNCGKLSILYLMTLINIFSFVWIILGSIIFWRDCISCKPIEINILMYFSLIIGYFNILFSFSQNNYMLKSDNKKKPLLEI